MYTNVIDKDHTCGILVRPILYLIIKCIFENYFKPVAKQNYIETKQCHEDSLEKFRMEIANAAIYDKLDKDLSANPNDNYKVNLKFYKMPRGGSKMVGR